MLCQNVVEVVDEHDVMDVNLMYGRFTNEIMLLYSLLKGGERYQHLVSVLCELHIVTNRTPFDF